MYLKAVFYEGLGVIKPLKKNLGCSHGHLDNKEHTGTHEGNNSRFLDPRGRAGAHLGQLQKEPSRLDTLAPGET